MSRPISISELAELTGKDRSEISACLKDLPHTIGKKNAKLYDSREALTRIYSRGALTPVEERRAEAQLVVEELRADKLRMDLKIRSGELVHVDEVAGVVEAEYAAVRAGFLALGSKLSRDFSGMTPIEVKARVDEEVNSILSELSADQPKESYATETA